MAGSKDRAECALDTFVPPCPVSITRCELSKLTESKAGPLGKDIKAIVMANVIAVASLVVFGAMGLAIASVATGESLFQAL